MSDASDYVEETCDVCGDNFQFCLIVNDYLSVGLGECKKGHHFCLTHLVGGAKFIENDDRFGDENAIEFTGKEADTEVDVTDFDSKYCPICTIKMSKDFTKEVTENEILQYMLKKNNISRKGLKDQLKKEFPTGIEFAKFIDKGK